MKDQIDDLMEAAEACVAEATPATLEPEKLTDPETRAAYWKHLYMESDQRNEKLQLVKGEFSSLEDALRAQVQKMEADLLAAKWRSAQAEIERDEWRSKYEHTLAANVI